MLSLPNISNIATRPATMDDLSFIDGLQKRHAKMVGWMPTKQLEGKIAAGQVIVAVGARPASPSPSPSPSPTPTTQGDAGVAPTGYCIGHDQYFKRDDVGIIYQMNVVPGRQRSFVGATLLKAMFERAAWGCRLFCCWCAQDIDANRFWEAMGFVPLAFRAGSREKGRVHIFWQKRIRAGDTSTPWWFPSKTSGGAMNEDRVVLPIPPGTHWSDAKPIVLPGAQLALPDEDRRRGSRKSGPKKGEAQDSPTLLRGFQFASAKPPQAAAAAAKPARKKRPHLRNDPKLIAAARELRDRWLEHVNGAGASELVGTAKYEVSRALPIHAADRIPQSLPYAMPKALPQAA